MSPAKKTKVSRPSGRLSGLRAYLAGPIEFVTEAEAISWRLDVTGTLHEFGVQIFDPCRSFEEDLETQRSFIRRLKEQRKFELLREKVKKIVRQDLRCIDLVDFMIAYMPSGVKVTGTLHELIEADREKKPTLVVTDDLTKLPEWIFGIIPIRYLFESFDSMLEYLGFVDRGFIEDDRWQFLEFI